MAAVSTGVVQSIYMDIYFGSMLEFCIYGYLRANGGLQFSCLKRCNFNILQCLRKNGRNRIMKVIFANCNSAEKAKFCGCEMFLDEYDERKDCN